MSSVVAADEALPVEPASPALNQARLSRLRLLLLWEGRLNRGRLIELFGLSPVRASEWIREFRDAHPDWVDWNSKTRSFHATSAAYRAQHTKLASEQGESIAQYVALVGLPDAILRTGAAARAPVISAFRELSAPEPRVFALLREAILERHILMIRYRSMRDPKPHPHDIEPHSLVRTGRRWHVRAYSLQHEEFRDFALGRITDARTTARPSAHTAANDAGWTTSVAVRLVAHPRLLPEQQDLVRFEYFNDTAGRVETCRGALVAYFVHEWRAATDVERQLPPDYQLAVHNLKEVRPWLFPH